MKVFAVRKGTRYYLVREREVSVISETIKSVPRSQVSVAKTMMLDAVAKDFKIFIQSELVVDPHQRVRDGPLLYQWMSAAYYGFKRDDKVMFFNASDVEIAADENST